MLGLTTNNSTAISGLTWKLGTLEKSEKFSSLVLLSPPKDVDLAENLPEQKEGSWKPCQ